MRLLGHWMGRRRCGLLLRSIIMSGVLVVLTPPAHAQGDPDAGQKVVGRWCTSCHLVGANEAATDQSGSDAAPPLSSVLTEENLTPDQVWGWLAEPHPPMPGLDLSRSEIDDIIAYLESIKHH
jgi:cytochrome c